MNLLTINGQDLVRGIKSGCINLEHNREKVNLLNVFPVPDGDTGTNMYLTILSAVKESEKVSDQSLKVVVKKISMGALMGARGNSGVILSQVFRGIAKVLETKENANASDIALALKSGAQTAYEAVMKPVEGTILTVVREVASTCEQQAKTEQNILNVLVAGLRTGYITLEKTPNMLPILKESGVVDAGGQGFLYFMEGLIQGLANQVDYSIDISPTVAKHEQAESRQEVIDLEFQYCTELLIKGNDLDNKKISEQLLPLGDSLLAVGESDLMKIHIHSNHPGRVLETCLQWGELLDIKINNMLEEVHEQMQNFEKSNNEQPVVESRKKIGVVAVSAGDGIAEILKSLGVDIVIPGGQTMNPSTEDLVNACQEAYAETVLLFPNNGNIIMAAQQASKLLTEYNIQVIPTKSVLQGIAAMVLYEPDGDVSHLLEVMNEAIENTSYAEVTYSVRDTVMNGLDIKNGDIIGLIEGKIAYSGTNPEEVVIKLLEKMVDDETQLISVFFGEDINEQNAQELHGKIQDIYGQCEVEIYNGGQPFYWYQVLIEK